MRLVGKTERRKILLVGTIGTDAIGTARQLATECQLWQGREQDMSYAYRVAGIPVPAVMQPAFRAPHHTIGQAAMEGKMRNHRWAPGELQLAHGGVLLLHEAPEFPRVVLGAVADAWKRQYLAFSSRSGEDVQGAGEHDTNRILVPCVFTLVMSAKPCPCGWRGAAGRTCECSERQVERWFERIAMLTDGAERIDLPGRVV